MRAGKGCRAGGSVYYDVGRVLPRSEEACKPRTVFAKLKVRTRVPPLDEIMQTKFTFRCKHKAYAPAKM